MASSSLVSVDEPVHSSSSSSSSVRLLSQTPYWLLGGVDVDFGSIHPLRPGLVLPSMSDSAALGNVANRNNAGEWVDALSKQSDLVVSFSSNTQYRYAGDIIDFIQHVFPGRFADL